MTCADGTICPPSNVCARSDVGGGCLDPELCASAADGTACAATGACQSGACVPAACGNGRLERDEACDDGNLMNHDGCSSTCIPESPVWRSSTAPQPPSITGFGFAYDRMRGRVLTFGSCFTNESWEWDGTQWTQPTPASLPPARCEPGMAYDDVHRKMIVFGGSYGTATTDLLADTWASDGTTWTRVATTGPAARYDAGMAFDPATTHVLVFAGLGQAYYADTWSWDGTAWTKLSTPTQPSSRQGPAMATDLAGHRTVMFGGIMNGLMNAETWVWDGSAWSQLHPLLSPPARSSHAFAFAETTGLALLYGGGDSIGDNVYDAWTLAGDSWQQLVLTTTPMISNPRMAYDPIREEFVIAGRDPAATSFQSASLQWSYAGEPEETCIAGQDGDGDGLAGCADPDCWALCTPFCPPGASGCDASAPHCGDGQCNMLLEQRVCPEDCP